MNNSPSDSDRTSASDTPEVLIAKAVYMVSFITPQAWKDEALRHLAGALTDARADVERLTRQRGPMCPTCDPPLSCAYCDRAQLRAALEWIEKQPVGVTLVHEAFAQTTHSVTP